MKLSVETIAEMAHEINRAYCKEIGDNTQVSWDDAEPWQRESAMVGVMGVIQNPDVTPEEAHEMWMKHKQDNGWTYGEVKCPKAKTHPCMVPYSELPKEQRVKDYLFKGIVDLAIGVANVR